ncbi:MAG: helix-turn-helix domain-containing protein [Candidatus Limnocylindria bacterium]
MLRSNVPRAIRYLRDREHLRQVDLAARAEVSRPTISRLERGIVRGVPLGTIESVAAALGASVEVIVRWHGEQLDRLIDTAHAWLQQEAAASLTAAGWTARPEVSFNHFGDRGRVDLLAFHAPLGLLLVVEVKGSLGDLQETLGRLDVKVRLGRSLADQSGWAGVRGIGPAFVFADTRSVRRTLAQHASLFARFTLRGRSAQAWIRRPAMPAPTGLIWFLNVPDSHGVSVTRRRRVRTVNSAG